MIVDVASLDCIYLSYDEPKAEENWARITGMIPWAKRVHGIKGIDSAHKAAAAASDTDRFILIDGDNVPLREFFDQQLRLSGFVDDSVFRWRAKNAINGLAYGNGGLSCWTKKFVEEMRTHENSDDPDTAVEFCWKNNYHSMHDVWSMTYPNGSPLQAFRAGFREGVKLCMLQGKAPSLIDFEKEIIEINLFRLKQWMVIGRDVENGVWAMLGARLGTHEYMGDGLKGHDFDHALAVDLDRLSDLARRYIDKDPEECLRQAANNLRNLLGWEIPEFAAEHSRFFKQYMPIEENVDVMLTERDYRATIAAAARSMRR